MDYHISKVHQIRLLQLSDYSQLSDCYGHVKELRTKRIVEHLKREDERKMHAVIPLKVMAFPDSTEELPFKK